MKKYLLLLAACFAMLWASSPGAAQALSIKMDNVTVKQAITELEGKSGYSFVFVANDLDTQKRVNVNAQNLKAAVEQIIAGQDLRYEIQGKNIVISKNKHNAGESATTQKPILVKGYVLDDKGEPLPGATVQIEGTNTGVMTNLDGSYEILATPNQQLTYSFIGVRPQTMTVGNKRIVNVELSEDGEQLEDAVVVAFGKQKKESVVGAITTIDTKELKVPSSDLTTALAGNVAGIISYALSGEPGQDNTEFFVRGVTTFEGATNPLILIDNIELTSTDLARLQPDDIESFSVLKDATATALYGSRAANGVILVTTKRGNDGPAKIFARVENSITSPTRVAALADNITYMKLANEAVLTRDRLGTLPFSQDKIENTGKPGSNPYIYPNNDWYDMLFKDYANSTRGTVNISGGGKISKYFVSIGYTKDTGILKVDKRNSFNNNIDSRTYTARANVDINVTRTTKLGVRISGNFDDYTGPLNGGSAVYNQVVHSNPVMFPAYYEPDEEHKYYEHILFGNSPTRVYTNPYAEMVRGYKDSDRSQMLSVLQLDQKLDFITKGLDASFMINISRLSSFSVSRFYNPYYYYIDSYDWLTGEYKLTQKTEGTEYLGYSESGKTVTNTLYTEGRLNYSRDFKGNGVSGLLVFTTHEKLNANAGNLLLSLPSRNVGLAGRFTYNFKKRYFAEFNFGYNGSERFSKNHRWGFFPSIGTAWVMSNEKFFKNIKKYVNNLKFRYSYGLVGNDIIGSSTDRFFYLSSINMDFGGTAMRFGKLGEEIQNGIYITKYADDNITWEKSYKQNFAVELGLFNKLDIIAEYYTERRTNLLMSRSYITHEMGLTADVRANVGEASAHGFDLQANYQQNWNRFFWTSARVNFTYARSKYIIFDEPTYKEWYRFHEGRPLGQAFGYIAERLFVDDAEARNSPVQTFGGEYGGGDIKYTDVNDDGQITAADMVPIGNPTSPEIIYGFGVSMGYRGFDFSVFFQGMGNKSFFIDPGSITPYYNETQLLKAIANDHWSETNQNEYALFPRLTYGYLNKNNIQRSTWWMRDGTFLRLKQAEFGYSLPHKWTDKMRIENLRFYVSGTNLFTWSRFKTWDVELSGNAFNYPIQRVVNLGLNITFK